MLSESFSENLFDPLTYIGWGLHLWFLGFLFAYTLLALPVFNWFKRESGEPFIAWLGRLVEKRDGILLFIIPLALARVLVQPFDPHPNQHGWLDFVYTFLFFILGYVIYADDRFPSAIRRNRWLLFASGILGLVVYFGLSALYGDIVFNWAQGFVWPWSIILIFSFTLMSWGWALFVLALAMKHLNFFNKWLVYGNETIMPFYLLQYKSWARILAIILGIFNLAFLCWLILPALLGIYTLIIMFNEETVALFKGETPPAEMGEAS